MTYPVSFDNFTTYDLLRFPHGFNCTAIATQSLQLSENQLYRTNQKVSNFPGRTYGDIPFFLKQQFEATVPNQIAKECCAYQTLAFTQAPYLYCKDKLISVKQKVTGFIQSVFEMFDECHTPSSITVKVQQLKVQIKRLEFDLNKKIEKEETQKPWSENAIQPKKSAVWPDWLEKYGISYPAAKHIIKAGQCLTQIKRTETIRNQCQSDISYYERTIEEDEKLFKLLTDEAVLISETFKIKTQILEFKTILNDLTNELNEETHALEELVEINKNLEDKGSKMDKIQSNMQDLSQLCDQTDAWDRYLVFCHDEIAYYLKRAKIFADYINRLNSLIKIDNIHVNCQQENLDACLKERSPKTLNQKSCSSSEQNLRKEAATLQDTITEKKQNLTDTLATKQAEKTRFYELEGKVSRLNQTMKMMGEQLKTCSETEDIPLHDHVEFCNKQRQNALDRLTELQDTYHGLRLNRTKLTTAFKNLQQQIFDCQNQNIPTEPPHTIENRPTENNQTNTTQKTDELKTFLEQINAALNQSTIIKPSHR